MDVNVAEDKYYRIRLLAFVVLGFAAALVLTWFMYVLIQTSQKPLDESDRVHLLDFVRIKKTEQSQQADRKPQRPAQAPPPPAPPVAQADSGTDASNSLSIDLSMQSQLDSGLNGFSIGAGEGEYLPIIKVAPAYPPRAAQQRLEGNCTVEYTVTTSGAVRDVSVVDDECEHRVFERPSKRAAERFKYKPRVINGEAVEVEGVRNRFIYVLED